MPSPLIDKPHGWFRRWFRKVWRVRGGGLYACGFAVSFILFELRSLGEDLVSLGGVLDGGIIGFVVDFIVDSLTNTVAALMWPLYVVQTAPPWGAVALGLAYAVFASWIKPPLERWMFRDAAGDEQAVDTSQA